MKSVQFKTPKEDKLNINFNDNIYNIENQTVMLYKCYLNEKSDESNKVIQSINKKLQGYKQQDSKHQIYSKNHFIHIDTVILRLVESKLKCFYCNCNLMIFYKKCKQDNQWTLDRIDNNFGHNSNNIVISCLECNLKRRNTNLNKFKFTKQLNIKKIDS
tara:strand:- start:21621 stop:22097 length:477 start_codon:yes stop_codon:yes gene_type:complete